MQKNYFAFLFTIVCIIFLGACSKNEDSDPSTTTDYVNANVNGVAFNSKSVYVFNDTFFAPLIEDQLAIIGYDQELFMGKQIALAFPTASAPGTYTLAQNINDVAGADYLKSITEEYPSYQGTLTITSNNTSTRKVKGSFNFKGLRPATANLPADTVTVIGGVFSVGY